MDTVCNYMTIDSFTGEYRFLSNFWLCDIWYEGKLYKSVEHAYQAAKCTNENDKDDIRKVPKPSMAKNLGKHIDLRPDWESIKLNVMMELVTNKFITHEALKQKLLLTGDAELIEGNYWDDTFWGICNGKGENWLGEILMSVRGDMKHKLEKQ